MKNTLYYLTVALTAASLFLISGVSASDTDDRIESSAKQSYVFNNYLKDDNIKIESREGIVTLTGTVSDESGKALAQETVAGITGVMGIDNKLEIENEVPAIHSDKWIIGKVKSALLFHRNVSSVGTEVLSENGIVTLRGEVTSLAQKDLTTEYARDVEGVKDVKNEMTLPDAAIKPGTTTISQKMDAVGESIDDASITALVKMTLLYHRSTSAINTTVKTKEGVVTLGGKAGNSAARDLATKFVSDIHGVKKVVNNMSIN